MRESVVNDVVNSGAEPFRLLMEELDALLNMRREFSDTSISPMTIRNVIECWEKVAADDGNDISPYIVPPQMRDVLSKLYATREQLRSLTGQIQAAQESRAPEPIVQ